MTKTVTIRASFDPVRPTAVLTGPDSRAFALSGNRCTRQTLAPVATCTLLVTFNSAGARGARRAMLHVTHDRVGPPLEVPLIASVGQSAPALRGLSLTNSSFAVDRAVTSRRKHAGPAPKGTTILFRLSEPAAVLIAVQQQVGGRLRHKRCLAPSPALVRAKGCTRAIARGSFTRRRGDGINHVLFSGRLRSGALAPGRYTLVLTPTAFGHIRGRSRSIGFTIVRG